MHANKTVPKQTLKTWKSSKLFDSLLGLVVRYPGVHVSDPYQVVSVFKPFLAKYAWKFLSPKLSHNFFNIWIRSIIHIVS